MGWAEPGTLLLELIFLSPRSGQPIELGRADCNRWPAHANLLVVDVDLVKLLQLHLVVVLVVHLIVVLVVHLHLDLHVHLDVDDRDVSAHAFPEPASSCAACRCLRTDVRHALSLSG